MNKYRLLILTSLISTMVLSVSICHAENIDPDNDGSQYAYGENIGWLNFEPNVPSDPCDYSVTVSDTELTGFIWAENIGWISLSCENTASCGTVDYGVVNNGGNLFGYAWSENAGWISFSCGNTTSCATVDYGVTIDGQGNFDGYAWAENIGWIHLSSINPIPYGVQACKVNLEDFANFALYWLDSGPGLPADLKIDNDVNIDDLNYFASYWLDFCPDAWLLK